MGRQVDCHDIEEDMRNKKISVFGGKDKFMIVMFMGWSEVRNTVLAF